MACKNCNHSLSEEDKFCNECGAQVIQNRLTIKNLFTEFHETFFSWDANRPIKTFVDLFKRPEDVIGGYIDGVRKKYLNPFGFVVISLTISGFFYFVALKFSPEALEAAISIPGGSDLQMEVGRNYQHSVFEYNSLIFFTLLPVFALISFIVFYNKKKYNYAEHLIINLYAYSQVSIATTLTLFLTLWYNTISTYISISAIVFQILYYAYVLKRLFKLTWKQLLIKTLYFLAILIPFYIIGSIIAVIIIFATGGFDALFEEIKAKNAMTYIASSFKNWTS